jgi:FkbM family methyltransferase
VSKLSNLLVSAQTRGLGATAGAALGAGLGAVQRVLGQRFVERRIHDYKMLLDLDDRGISRTLLLFGERELEHKIMLERVLKPGMTVLDIGANIGYYALMELCLIKPGGTLIAIEPSPSNVALLKRNLALNGHGGIEIHEMAISNQISKRKFFISEMSNLNTFHDTGTGSLHLKGEAIEVETTTVPAVLRGRRPDLVRMDVEGHEVEVLDGMLPAIRENAMAPMVIFETHLSRYSAEHDIGRPLREMFALGYKVLLAGSSSARGTKTAIGHGYTPVATLRSDGDDRAIFENIAPDHALDMITRTGGLRTVLLAPAKAG